MSGQQLATRHPRDSADWEGLSGCKASLFEQDMGMVRGCMRERRCWIVSCKAAMRALYQQERGAVRGKGLFGSSERYYQPSGDINMSCFLLRLCCQLCCTVIGHIRMAHGSGLQVCLLQSVHDMLRPADNLRLVFDAICFLWGGGLTGVVMGCSYE